jgi:lipoyl(octanoyl) transferase
MNTAVRTDPEKIQVDTPGKVSFSHIHTSMLELQSELGSATAGQDRLFLFEPSPVVTLGSRSADSSAILDPEKLKTHDVEIHTVDRGGEATYHGPGQLLAYPVIRLREGERDLHELLRKLEEAVILTLADWEIVGERRAGHTGVWIGYEKIASVGMSVRRWVTGHGLALCVNGDQRPFDWIVPCGLQNCPVVTMENLLGTNIDLRSVEDRLRIHLLHVLNRVEAS